MKRQRRVVRGDGDRKVVVVAVLVVAVAQGVARHLVERGGRGR